MCICSLYMRGKSVKPGHCVLIELHHQISDLGDDIALELCERVEKMSVFEAPHECRVEFLRRHVGVSMQGPIQMFRPRELRHVFAHAASRRWPERVLWSPSTS